MASIEPYVRQKARVLTDRLLSRSALSPSGTTNVFELCGLFSFEVVCKIGFAKDFLEDGDDSAIPLLKAMDGRHHAMAKRSGLSTKMPGAIGHAYRCFDYWECRSREMVEHFLNNTSEDDAYLLTPLIRNTDNFLGRQLNNEELVEEAMGAMFAGSGTTSTTLTYLFYAISRPENQSIQERLREEVLSISGDLQSIKQLPYLNAVIKETFRLYPTIISTLPRVLDEPLTIESHVLPPGTIVGMQNYVHQRDPTVFPDPERFVPERWLQSTDAMDEALTPFSLGRRNCIGQNLAWLELWLAVYEVVSKVRLTLGKEMRAEDMDMEDRFNTAPKGRKLMLQVTGV
ncbi:hypothetical protein H2203_008258 [Taxawa tesnikishii (nom. ined.)]|nr:hypothetical protein H2203_008258 [Dothideales sp. JES 119]